MSSRSLKTLKAWSCSAVYPNRCRLLPRSPITMIALSPRRFIMRHLLEQYRRRRCLFATLAIRGPATPGFGQRRAGRPRLLTWWETASETLRPYRQYLAISRTPLLTSFPSAPAYILSHTTFPLSRPRESAPMTGIPIPALQPSPEGRSYLKRPQRARQIAMTCKRQAGSTMTCQSTIGL